LAILFTLSIYLRKKEFFLSCLETEANQLKAQAQWKLNVMLSSHTAEKISPFYFLIIL